MGNLAMFNPEQYPVTYNQLRWATRFSVRDDSDIDEPLRIVTGLLYISTIPLNCLTVQRVFELGVVMTADDQPQRVSDRDEYGRRVDLSPDEIIPALDWWCKVAQMHEEGSRLCSMFMTIAPFIEMNKAGAAVIWNWKNGLLKEPLDPSSLALAPMVPLPEEALI